MSIHDLRPAAFRKQPRSRTSEPGTYLVTTRRGEIIEVAVDDAGTRVRWITVNPGRRPLPFASFAEGNRVFDTTFEVGQWGGVQWTTGAAPYTPTSLIASIERVIPTTA